MSRKLQYLFLAIYLWLWCCLPELSHTNFWNPRFEPAFMIHESPRIVPNVDSKNLYAMALEDNTTHNLRMVRNIDSKNLYAMDVDDNTTHNIDLKSLKSITMLTFQENSMAVTTVLNEFKVHLFLTLL